MSEVGPSVTVGQGVVAEMIRLAAFEVPGVQRIGRGGPPVRAWFAGPPLRVRMRDGRVDVRLWIVARPGQPLASLARDVRAAIAAAVERLLGLEVGEIAVVVDGVGG